MALPTHAMPIGGCAAAQQQHDYQMYLDATNKCNANPNPAMLLAKKGGTIKSVGKGITKEKVTISPNLDAMQYELMSVKHFKKAK